MSIEALKKGVKLSSPTDFSIFLPETATGIANNEFFILVSTNPSWSAQYRDVNGYTGVHQKGAPKNHFTRDGAIDYGDMIRENGNQHITHVMRWSTGTGSQRVGSIVHSFVSESVVLRDEVGEYPDAGSW